MSSLTKTEKKLIKESVKNLDCVGDTKIKFTCDTSYHGAKVWEAVYRVYSPKIKRTVYGLSWRDFTMTCYNTTNRDDLYEAISEIIEPDAVGDPPPTPDPTPTPSDETVTGSGGSGFLGGNTTYIIIGAAAIILILLLWDKGKK